MRFTTRWIGLLALALVASLVWLNAQNTKRIGTLFVNLTTDDPWRVEMAMHYATHARELGYNVVVFLNVRGVNLARKTPPAALKSSQEMLKALIQRGAEVIVCPRSSQRAGVKPVADWIQGVIPGSPQKTIPVQMAPDTQVMSY